MQPFPVCPGIHTAELESLFAERDDLRHVVEDLTAEIECRTAERDAAREAIEIQKSNHMRQLNRLFHIEAERDSLRADIARLRDAAAGRGMVSEQDGVEDVAVLVVGLHERIATLQDDLKAVLKFGLRHEIGCAALDTDYTVDHDHPPMCDCRPDTLIARPGVRAVLDQQSC